MRTLRALAVLLLFGCLTVIPLAPAQAVVSYERGALDLVLEAYGLLNPGAGSLTFDYRVSTGGKGVEFIITGRRPGLADLDATQFERVVALITGGGDFLSKDRAERFLYGLKYRMAVYRDRQANGTEVAAKRFGITAKQVEELVDGYLAFFGAPLPKKSNGPKVSA